MKLNNNNLILFDYNLSNNRLFEFKSCNHVDVTLVSEKCAQENLISMHL